MIVSCSKATEPGDQAIQIPRFQIRNTTFAIQNSIETDPATMALVH